MTIVKQDNATFSSHKRYTSSYISQLPNFLTVQAYEAHLAKLIVLHLIPYPTVSWEQVLLTPAPYEEGGIGPHATPYELKLSAFTSRWYEKLFPTLLMKRKAALQRKWEQATKRDQQLYHDWQQNKSAAEQIVAGNMSTYYLTLEQYEPLLELSQFISSFSCQVISPTEIEVNIIVNPAVVIPTYVLSLTKTGKLSKKEMTKGKYYDYIQDYVCSCSLAVALRLQALLPLHRVYVHSSLIQLDASIGKMSEQTILSVCYERSLLSTVQLAHIDPSELLKHTIHHMKFMKLSGFKPVEKLRSSIIG